MNANILRTCALLALIVTSVFAANQGGTLDGIRREDGKSTVNVWELNRFNPSDGVLDSVTVHIKIVVRVRLYEPNPTQGLAQWTPSGSLRTYLYALDGTSMLYEDMKITTIPAGTPVTILQKSSANYDKEFVVELSRVLDGTKIEKFKGNGPLRVMAITSGDFNTFHGSGTVTTTNTLTLAYGSHTQGGRALMIGGGLAGLLALGYCVHRLRPKTPISSERTENGAPPVGGGSTGGIPTV